MDIKNFEDYSFEEKKNLLIHWWHYYGKCIYTFEELSLFIESIEENPDAMMDMATLSFIFRKTNEPFILAIQNNKLEEFKKSVRSVTKLYGESLIEFNATKNNLLSQIVNTYNNPEPDIPMTLGITID